eukprot:19997-Heterococcus_DN1.PRE.2
MAQMQMQIIAAMASQNPQLSMQMQQMSMMWQQQTAVSELCIVALHTLADVVCHAAVENTC